MRSNSVRPDCLKTSRLRSLAPGLALLLLAGTAVQADVFPRKKPTFNVSRRMAIGRLYEQQGRLDRAIETYRAILEYDGSHAEAQARYQALTSGEPVTASSTPPANAQPRSLAKGYAGPRIAPGQLVPIPDSHLAALTPAPVPAAPPAAAPTPPAVKGAATPAVPASPVPVVAALPAAAAPVIEVDAGDRAPERSFVAELAEEIQRERELVGPEPGSALDPEELARLLSHPRARVRKQAAYLLGQQGELARSTTPRLEAALRDPSRYVRLHAAFALWKIRHDELHAINFEDALASPDPALSSFASTVFRETGSDPGPLTADLTRLARTGSGAARIHAAETLWKLQQQDAQLIDVMVVELQTGDRSARWLAAYALAETRVATPHVVAALGRALEDREPCVQTAAAFALGEMGSAASPELEKLWHAIEAEDSADDFRMAAFHAVHVIDPEFANRIDWDG